MQLLVLDVRSSNANAANNQSRRLHNHGCNKFYCLQNVPSHRFQIALQQCDANGMANLQIIGRRSIINTTCIPHKLRNVR